jgi:cysteine synthase A
MAEVLEKELRPNDNFRGIALTTGSAGTIACGDYLKHRFPSIKVTASEALQCPTLLQNGFGAHRIEGIGDKHVPWIHNVANTDMITAIDDNAVVNISRLFNESAGKEFLVKKGVPEELVGMLDLFGFSGIANLLSTIKMAKYYEFSENDVLVTVLTDSMELYTSRLGEYHEESGKFSSIDAAEVFAADLMGERTDHLLELSYLERKRVHNLKYYTWVEQQGKTYEEIQAQWFDPNYWFDIQSQTDEIDELIVEFNQRTGLLK